MCRVDYFLINSSKKKPFFFLFKGAWDYIKSAEKNFLESKLLNLIKFIYYIFFKNSKGPQGHGPPWSYRLCFKINSHNYVIIIIILLNIHTIIVEIQVWHIDIWPFGLLVTFDANLTIFRLYSWDQWPQQFFNLFQGQ